MYNLCSDIGTITNYLQLKFCAKHGGAHLDSKHWEAEAGRSQV